VSAMIVSADMGCGPGRESVSAAHIDPAELQPIQIFPPRRHTGDMSCSLELDDEQQTCVTY
jgi:hypothetical protein